MIKVDEKEYENVSLNFYEGDYNILVTYKEDGEAQMFYTRPECRQDVYNFLADTTDGQVSNVKFWGERTWQQ